MFTATVATMRAVWYRTRLLYNDTPCSRLRSPALAADASIVGDMSEDHDTGVSMRASPAQLRTADEVSVTTKIASIFRASFATPSPTKNSRSNAGSPLASSSPQPKTVHSGQLLGSRALAASPNAVTADSDSWDTRITAGVVEAATVPTTADMTEREEIAEAPKIPITWHSAEVCELQGLPLSTWSNQTHQPSVTSPSAPVASNHLMRKGKKF